MLKWAVMRVAIAMLLIINQSTNASTGALFNVTSTGTPGSVSMVLCLNGVGTLSCQNYTVSALSVTISPTIPNHVYPSIGIKINTPGYTLGNIGLNCVLNTNGYCLFSASHSQPKTLSLVVSGALTLSPTTLPMTTTSRRYNQTITASGGITPYQYRVTSGALPPGLSLSLGGVISGTTIQDGTFPFTITATDSNTPNAKTGSQAYTLQVSIPPPTPTTTVVYSSINPRARNLSVTLSAKVTSSNGVPSAGTVEFIANATPIGGCTAQSLTSGIATCVTSFSTIGTKTIVANYTGGSGFSSSTSSSFSQSIVTAVVTTVPAAPQDVTVIPRNGQVTINWYPPANTGGAAVTGYTVMYGTTASAIYNTPACTNTSNLSCTISGLTDGTPYTFTVVAINSRGTGPTSFSSSVAPHSGLTASPSNLALSGLGNAASRTITITNNSGSDVTIDSISAPFPTLPSGTTVDVSQANACVFGSELAAHGGFCTITIAPGSNSTSTCTTGIVPTPSVITVTDNNSDTTTANVVILGYGCQYQEGYLFSIDDTTPITSSIGGTVITLNDQGSYIFWNFNLGKIWGVNDASTIAIPSPRTPPALTLGQLNCNAVNDGACATNNTFIIYGVDNGYAVGLCKTTINGYTDWYLPSVCELGPFGSTGSSGSYPSNTNSQTCTAGSTNIQNQLASTGIVTNFNAITYWSSTEDSIDGLTAWYQQLSSVNGFQTTDAKRSAVAGARCSRALTL